MAECAAVMTDATQCGSTIQYVPAVKFICTQPAGHDGAHFEDGGPMAWTCGLGTDLPRGTIRDR
jgi:hypothetical protein